MMTSQPPNTSQEITDRGQALISETKEHLDDWASWASSHGINVGYPNMTPYQRLRGSSVKSRQISDEEGKWIDSRVSELKAYDGIAHSVIVALWINRLSITLTAKVLRVSESKVKTSRDFGLHWIAFGLHNDGKTSIV